MTMRPDPGATRASERDFMERSLKYLWLFVVATMLITLLHGCGGGSPPKHRYEQVHPGHPCTPHNYYMQCALKGQELPQQQRSNAQTLSGRDFGWSCPDPGGFAFGASYFSFDSSKDWTRGCVNLYRLHGKGTVGVWETAADEATRGFNAGYNDAFYARGKARGVGEPDNRPIDYAIDCDCGGGQVSSYFSGVDAGTAAVLHLSHADAVRLVGAYGGYRPLRYLCSNGLVGHTNWQTYAWSGGLWLPASCAPLEQYLIGSTVDFDRALAPD